MTLIQTVLNQEVEEVHDLAAWLARVEARSRAHAPIERALLGAAAADRIAGVFAVAYRAALCQLLPDCQAAALCVTEAKGNHPRALATTATPTDTGVHIRGAKVWATLADRAETLLVAAVEGEQDGRPAIGVYAVPANLPGVTRTAMPPTPFIPEVPHFQIALDVTVPATERIPGDGWTGVVKPFRTVEDLFVSAALCAFGLKRGPTSDWAAVLVGLVALADQDPSDPGVHVALHGLMARTHELAHHLAENDEILQRDLGVLAIAGKARSARHRRALERLGA